jgi:hypothetical protein
MNVGELPLDENGKARKLTIVGPGQVYYVTIHGSDELGLPPERCFRYFEDLPKDMEAGDVVLVEPVRHPAKPAEPQP